LKRTKQIFFFSFLLFSLSSFSQILVKGLITEPDSVTRMPFVFVINTKSGHGIMSDGNGHFAIEANLSDTIMFSFIGYKRLKLSASQLYKNNSEDSKVIMIETEYKLNQVIVSDFKLKPYEKDYMKRVIQGSKTTVINAAQSPISALYMQFSQKGKEQRKLARIFEEIFIQEEVSKKFNPEVLRRLTGDDSIDFERFRKYCYYVSDEFILTHEGYDLYKRISECYYRWKQESE
jgi:hypothetical protein